MTREQLMAMPILQLRRLDIKSKEEELLVQEVLNEKLKNEPKPNKAFISPRETDNMTPEKEAQLQAKLDGKSEVASEATPEVAPETITATELVIETSEPAPSQTVEIIEQTVTSTEKKAFCEFCTSKGVRHKKECARLQTNIKTI